VEFSHVVIIEL
jgi:hypothetical protein